MRARRPKSDAMRVDGFSRQVYRGLFASNIGFAVFDRWFRYRSVNEALAVMHGVPVQDHWGENVRKITGDMAEKVEPALNAVFDTGKVISGLQVIGKIPMMADPGHWIDTFLPIRNVRGRIENVGVLVTEV